MGLTDRYKIKSLHLCSMKIVEHDLHKLHSITSCSVVIFTKQNVTSLLGQD